MPVNPASGLWRLYTPGGTPYRNVSLQGVTTREEEGDESSATQVIIIDSGNLGSFLAEAFPPPNFRNGIAFVQQPVLPGTAMVPKSVSYESWTGNLPIDPSFSDLYAPAGTYDSDLKVTIEYGTVLESHEEKDPSRPETFLEVSANASGSFFSSPNPQGAEWVLETIVDIKESVTEVNLPYAIPEPQIEWSVRWSKIDGSYFTDTLMGRLRNAMGKVNSEEMVLLKNAPEDTILFTGFSYRQQFTYLQGYSGNPPIQLEMKFLEKNFPSGLPKPGGGPLMATHQFAYKSTVGDIGKGWRKLLIDGSPLFQQENLNAIWTNPT